MDFIEKWKFKLLGRTMPVFNIEEADANGKVQMISLSWQVRRANSLLKAWDSKGEEIRPGKGLMPWIDHTGLMQKSYVTFKGMTTDLYTVPCDFPNREDIIGTAATMDDIRDNMDTGMSTRRLIMGILIGIFVGWLIIGPIMSKVFS